MIFDKRSGAVWLRLDFLYRFSAFGTGCLGPRTELKVAAGRGRRSNLFDALK